MIKQNYNNFCKKCRNRKHWDSLYETRVRHLLAEKRDGKRITIRLTKRIESKLAGNISQIVLEKLAYEVAKEMNCYDDQELSDKSIVIKQSELEGM